MDIAVFRLNDFHQLFRLAVFDFVIAKTPTAVIVKLRIQLVLNHLLNECARVSSELSISLR